MLFPARGIAPLGYAAFAFALGVTAGVLIRRTVPAMAATLATFLFIQIAWPIWVRPHLIPPPTRSSRSPPRTSLTLTWRSVPAAAPSSCPACPA